MAGLRVRLTAALLGETDADDRDRAGRLATGLYVAAAVDAFLLAPLLPREVWIAPLLLAAGVALVSAGVFFLLPWRRLPRRATLVPTLWSFVIMGTAGWFSHGVEHFLVFWPLAFVYVGLTQPSGTSLVMTAPAMASGLLAEVRAGEFVPGDVISTVMVAVGIGELLSLLIGLHRAAARTDALTGLTNRRGMYEQLTLLPEGGAVIMFDLDHFKEINDTAGHQAGDEVLRAFADTLRASVRAGDCAARYGGEEFAVIVTEGAETAAATVVERLTERWRLVGSPRTFSAGVAVRRPGDTPEASLSRADEALYAAKRAGRNQVLEAAAVSGQRPARFGSRTASAG